MAKVLIVYGTTEGQTAKIAQHIGDTARRLGHDPAVQHAPEVMDDSLEGYHVFIVGGSLHEGRYQRVIGEFLERHRSHLGARPSAFFSVSLAAASRDPQERAEAVRLAKAFAESHGWTPAQIASFAGALKYTQYSWLKRMLMKHISGKEGGDTDTSRDFEYTDWDEVTAFTERFLREAARPAPRR